MLVLGLASITAFVDVVFVEERVVDQNTVRGGITLDQIAKLGDRLFRAVDFAA